MIRGSTNILKVPEGLLARANKRDVLPDVFFYYSLKSINTEGFIRRSDVLKIREVYPKSLSTIYRMINKLRSLGWLRSDARGYSLISYNRLFRYFKYDMTPVRNWSGIVTRLGSFRIFEISADMVKYDLREAMEVADLKHAIKRNARCRKSMPYKMMGGNIGSYMSCIGVAKLFGYSTKSIGHKIERRLVDKGFIAIKNRCSIADMNVRKNRRAFGGHYIHHGVLMKREMNEFRFLI